MQTTYVIIQHETIVKVMHDDDAGHSAIISMANAQATKANRPALRYSILEPDAATVHDTEIDIRVRDVGPTETRYAMAEGVVVETTDALGRVIDRRTEWYDTDLSRS